MTPAIRDRIIVIFGGLSDVTAAVLSALVLTGAVDLSAGQLTVIAGAVAGIAAFVVQVVRGWEEEPVYIALQGASSLAQVALALSIGLGWASMSEDAAAQIVIAVTAFSSYLSAVLRGTVTAPATLAD